MKILIVHNFYRQPGGEDVVFREEVRLLRDAGHEVVTMTADNDEVVGGGSFRDGIRSVWNRGFAARVDETVRRHGSEVAHFHNTLPVVSPASLRAARGAGAAVVATLHNYRLVCPSATLFRDGQVCESCLKTSFPWRGVALGCYRGSKLATAAVGVTTLAHRALGTWRNKVDRFVVLTEFAKGKFASAGIPESKIVVKPNFVTRLDVPGGTRDSVLFVGRLSAEKGIETLLRAAEFAPDLSFRIAGDGPLANKVRACANELSNVTWLGACTREQIAAELGRAVCLAFPSQWYEGMPMTILEAFSAGVPVVASRCGAIPEIVHDEQTGLLVPTGDAKSLARAARRMQQMPSLREELSRGALLAYESLYRPSLNLQMLEQVYTDAIAQRHLKRRVS
jgi:glycosyltransferase involved in cell wall biosynthesis